jgi:hypothetical protein
MSFSEKKVLSSGDNKILFSNIYDQLTKYSYDGNLQELLLNPNLFLQIIETLPLLNMHNLENKLQKIFFLKELLQGYLSINSSPKAASAILNNVSKLVVELIQILNDITIETEEDNNNSISSSIKVERNKDLESFLKKSVSEQKYYLFLEIVKIYHEFIYEHIITNPVDDVEKQYDDHRIIREELISLFESKSMDPSYKTYLALLILIWSYRRSDENNINKFFCMFFYIYILF